MALRRNRSNLFYALHVLLPLLLGFGLYVLLRPEVLAVRAVFDLLPFDLPQPLQRSGVGSSVIRLLRCHAADFLWGYALAMALFWAGDRYGYPPGKSIGFSIFADLLMELLQLTPLLSGVFDLRDIFVQILGTGIAVCAAADYNTLFRHIKERKERNSVE